MAVTVKKRASCKNIESIRKNCHHICQARFADREVRAHLVKSHHSCGGTHTPDGRVLEILHAKSRHGYAVARLLTNPNDSPCQEGGRKECSEIEH